MLMSGWLFSCLADFSVSGTPAKVSLRGLRDNGTP